MITSAANLKLRYVRALARRSFRAREGRMVVEGVRLVEEALGAAVDPAFALTTETLGATERGRALQARLEARGVPTLAVAPALFADLAGTVSPQGVLAVVGTPALAMPEAPDLVLVLDGLRDPGNLGTALRAAAAAGGDLALLAPGTVDATNSKVVRAAMGAHFRLPIRHADWAEIGARCAGLTTWVADAGGEAPYTDVDWRRPSALVVGGEADGPSAAARGAAAAAVAIPMPGHAESLNAASAAAVILFEAARQRGLAARPPAPSPKM